MASTNQAAKASESRISVRLPRNDIQKKYSVLKFNESNKFDFTSCGQAKIGRENNFKEFKSAYDLDLMPKTGAGSEFGREQKDEARKKKLGYRIRKYNPQDQPWSLKLGQGKQTQKFKGIRKGSLVDNSSYYIFTQCTDGAFEASPVDEWYDFLPVAKYKTLSVEEADEEFNKRGKALNQFAIMVAKRKKEAKEKSGDMFYGDSDDPRADPDKKKKSEKTGKSLILTEMDEWDESEEDDKDEDGGDNDDKAEDAEDKPKKKKKEKKEESDNEAVEEHDDFDEGQELDYESDSSSDSSDDEDRKYEEKGVDEEDALRKLLDSEDEDEEKKDEENEEEDETQQKEEQAKAPDDDSSSDSEGDSDPEKELASSPLFLMDKKPIKKPLLDEADAANSSRPTTPSLESSNGKRKKPDSQSPMSPAKKPKIEGSSTSTPMASGPLSGSGLEGLLKKYLYRKPMTLKDLLQKVRHKNPAMGKDQVFQAVGSVLQRLNLDQVKSNNKTYFSIKPNHNN